MESESYNCENSICLAGDHADEQVAGGEPDKEKPKEQSNELVKVNLASKPEKPRPVFLSAGLTTEIKKTGF